MRNIIVTGVSKGLGLEICNTLLTNDYRVFGLSRTITDDLEILKEQHNSKLTIIQFDLQNTEKIQQDIFSKIITLDIPIYGLINNAAIAYDDIITNLNLYSLEKMYKINVYSPMMIAKYVLRNMLLHKTHGSIVHLSSISVHTGYKGLSMYASTKGALEAFSKNTAREWGGKKIRSNCIVAGFMETGMSSSLSEQQKERIYKRTCMKEETKKKSVANTAEFLISDKSLSITGQNIFVDSGTI